MTLALLSLSTVFSSSVYFPSLVKFSVLDSHKNVEEPCFELNIYRAEQQEKVNRAEQQEKVSRAEQQEKVSRAE